MSDKSHYSLWMILISLLCCGCRSEVTEKYGASESFGGQNSPGGLSVLREMIKAQSRETQTLLNLSPTLESKMETIVWAPDYFPQHSKSVTDRFDLWLSQGGKTLIYIGRDYSAQSDYWNRVIHKTGSPLDLKQQSLVSIKEANQLIELDSKRDECRELLITPWFYYRRTLGEFRTVNAFQGEWSTDPELRKCYASIRSTLSPFDPITLNLLKLELDWNPVPPGTPTGNATNPNQIMTPSPPRKLQGQAFPILNSQSKAPYSRVWNTDDEQLLSIANGIMITQQNQPRTLLSTTDGTPLITEITFKNSSSRVIAISNSSMVSNLSLLNKPNRHLVNRLIGMIGRGQVGFISMDSDPPIKDGTTPEDHKGFEMLTIWPFNVMTIHAAVIALVAAIAAFPIFGRPRKIPPRPKSDFAEHIDSVGELLQATNGRDFAKDAITRYFRIVRKDLHSPWANRQTLDHEENVSINNDSNGE